MLYKDPEKQRLCRSQWNHAHREYYKQYRDEHKEELKEKNRIYNKMAGPKYYQKNKEKYKKYYHENRDKIFARRRAIRSAWMEIIKNRGMDCCSKCGYDKCFDAIDFHHINPEEKEKGVALLMYLKITTERLRELDKCIALCATCHREEHVQTKEGVYAT